MPPGCGDAHMCRTRRFEMGQNFERPRPAQCTPSHGVPPDAWARSHRAAARGGVPGADNGRQGPALPRSRARDQLREHAAWERPAHRRQRSTRVGPHWARAVPGASSWAQIPLPHARRPDRRYTVASRSTSSPAQENMAGFTRFAVDRIDSRRVRSTRAQSDRHDPTVFQKTPPDTDAIWTANTPPRRIKETREHQRDDLDPAVVAIAPLISRIVNADALIKDLIGTSRDIL
jgi:hypothetical protein